MDSDLREQLYLNRAKNELDLAKAIFKLSNEPDLKLNFELKGDSTFFSNVISNSYYCIFYSAKAFLYKKGVITESPEEHKKTYDEFKKFVDEGIIDVELLYIYKSMFIKAE